MTKDEWEIIYEIHGVLVEIASNSNVYSASLAKRLGDLDTKLLELPIEGEKTND